MYQAGKLKLDELITKDVHPGRGGPGLRGHARRGEHPRRHHLRLSRTGGTGIATTEGDERTARLRAGLARSRATGAPWLACAAGVQAVRQPGSCAGSDTLLGYSPGSGQVGSVGPAGPTDLAVLADLALGASVRACLGLDRRLATVSMTIQLANGVPDASQLRVRAPRSPSTGEELALARRQRARQPGGQVGSCSAAFVPQARGLDPDAVGTRGGRGRGAALRVGPHGR